MEQSQSRSKREFWEQEQEQEKARMPDSFLLKQAYFAVPPSTMRTWKRERMSWVWERETVREVETGREREWVFWRKGVEEGKRDRVRMFDWKKEKRTMRWKRERLGEERVWASQNQPAELLNPLWASHGVAKGK